jgi:hypothetical protein
MKTINMGTKMTGEDYVAQFERNAAIANLGDEASLVFFKEGLRPSMLRKITEAKATTLAQWKENTIAFDRAEREARELEKRQQGTSGGKPPSGQIIRTGFRPRFPTLTPAPTYTRGATAPLAQSQPPMAAPTYQLPQQRVEPPVTGPACIKTEDMNCFRCGEKGHMARNCSQRIRAIIAGMDNDALWAWAQQFREEEEAANVEEIDAPAQEAEEKDFPEDQE